MLLPTPTKYSFKDLGISAISSKFIPTLDQLGLGWHVLYQNFNENKGKKSTIKYLPKATKN